MLTRRLVKFTDRELSSIPPAFLRVQEAPDSGLDGERVDHRNAAGRGIHQCDLGGAAHGGGEAIGGCEADAPAAPVAPTPDVSSVSASPLAKAIEVTGFRIQMDPAKKSEIQYLVVNHTPARFTGVTVYVTLYAADAKAGQPPLCRFQFAAPNLAPFQAKDMTSAIEQRDASGIAAGLAGPAGVGRNRRIAAIR